MKNLSLYQRLVSDRDKAQFLKANYSNDSLRAHFLYKSEGLELITASGIGNDCLPSSLSIMSILGFEESDLSQWIRVTLVDFAPTILLTLTVSSLT